MTIFHIVELPSDQSEVFKIIGIERKKCHVGRFTSSMLPFISSARPAKKRKIAPWRENQNRNSLLFRFLNICIHLKNTKTANFQIFKSVKCKFVNKHASQLRFGLYGVIKVLEFKTKHLYKCEHGPEILNKFIYR